MIQPVVVAALASVIGGVAAVTARDGRVVVVGLMLTMVAAALAESSEPTALAVVFRGLGALLAAYLLWAAIRAESISGEGSGVGLMAELAIAAAAFWIGWIVAPVKPLAGPLAAQAGGFALVALAVVPLTGRDVLRVGVGAALLVIGGFLLMGAWAGPASALGQIAITALLVGIVGATSLLISPFDSPPRKLVAAAEAPDDVQLSLEEPAREDGRPRLEEGRRARRPGRQASSAQAALPAAPPAAPPTTPPTDATAGPVSPDVRRTRASTVRTLPARSLRGIARKTAPDATHGPGPIEGAVPGPSEPSAQTSPVANRVRRLRPREPRR